MLFEFKSTNVLEREIMTEDVLGTVLGLVVVPFFYQMDQIFAGIGHLKM